jgi:uncharacterized protein (TIGR03067 family)
MIRLWVISLALGLLSATALSADDKKDTDAFQGKWKIASIEVNGENVPTDQFEKAVLTITGDERLMKDDEKVVHRSKYKLDSSKNPKTIDFIVSEGTFKGKTLKGIYELKGDTHTINVTLEGDDRPTDFTAKANSNRLLQTFKRISGK